MDCFKGHLSDVNASRDKLANIRELVSNGVENILPGIKELSKLFIIEETQTKVPTLDIVTSEEAFSIEYRHNPLKSPINHYVKHIKEAMTSYQKGKTKFFANYISCVQSSGYGKSRLLIEAGKKHLNTVYACIRNYVGGYPLVHGQVYNHFQNYSSKDDMKIFISSTYEVALEYFKKVPFNKKAANLPLYELCAADKFASFWDDVIKKCAHTKSSLNASTQFSGHQFQYKNYADSNLKKESSGRIYIGKDHKNFELSELVIALDEARSLLIDSTGRETNAFRNLRSALGELESLNVIFVLTDTLSCLSNFSPATRRDPSYRPQKQFNLLPPFYELLTMDALVTSNRLPQLERLDNITIESLAILLSQGRPLWGALFLENNPTSISIIDTVEFARKKLLCKTDLVSKIDDEAILAIMAVRFGIHGVVDHTIASDLMSSYMGTGTHLFSLHKYFDNLILGMYIGEDRIRMVVRYPAEPAIAEAACQSLHRPISACEDELEFNEERLGAVLSMFIDKCLNGLISAGSVGELIARVILSLTFDKVILDRPESIQDQAYMADPNWPIFSYPVSLIKFLTRLVNPEYLNIIEQADQMEIDTGNAVNMIEDDSHDHDESEEEEEDILFILPESLKGGFVAFNTWTSMAKWDENDLTLKQFLKNCLNKRSAIILPPNHPGADLLIPVWLPDGKVGFILVQVKNRVNMDHNERIMKAGEHLEPEKCFGQTWLNEIKSENIGYISIYMEVGRDSNPWASFDDGELLKFNEKFPNHLMLLGFDSMAISSMECLESIFDLFCQRQVDHMEMSDRFTELKISEPLAFPGSSHYCSCKKAGCANRTCGCVKREIPCSQACTCSLNRILGEITKCKNQKNL